VNWARILFNVLRGKETPPTYGLGGRNDVDRASEAELRRARADREHRKRPIRVYGTTSRGTKVHIRHFYVNQGLFLCGAKPGPQPFSSVPPVDETELCSNCLNRVETEAE
jgi:hypothetical protein